MKDEVMHYGEQLNNLKCDDFVLSKAGVTELRAALRGVFTILGTANVASDNLDKLDWLYIVATKLFGRF